MKKTYLLVAVAALTVLSCKKDTKDLSTGQPVPSTDLVICYSDAWMPDQEVEGNGSSPCLVYNNKAYFFNRVGETPTSHGNVIDIYDGTSWQTKHSNIPEYFDFLED